MAEWDVAVGAELNRAERVDRFGGGQYGGIEPSSRTSNVFVYSDPARGGAYGYDFDGWIGGEFLYTGEGPEGDQRLTSGNRAIARHQHDGKALRVFVADGFVGTSKTRRQIYIGEFELSPEQPYFMAEAPDALGNSRTVIIFRLMPVGEHLHRPQDESKSGLPPAAPSTEEGDLGWAGEDTEVEASTTSTFERQATGATTAVRREAELVARYKTRLEHAGHVVQGRRLRPAGEYHWLRVDLLDTTTNELYEAKGVTTRDSVRLAIGQLYDYDRFVKAAALVVLLPTRPSADLLRLLADRGMSCVFEEATGIFARKDP